MDNAWKDKLRERFSDFSVPEPDGLWEGIEQGIAGKKRRNVIPVRWLSGSLAAAAAAVALVVLLPSTKEQPVNEPVSVLADTGKEDTPVLETAPDEVQEVSPEASVVPSVRSVAPVISRRPLLAENVIEENVIPEAPAVPVVSEIEPVEQEEPIQEGPFGDEPETALHEPETLPETIESFIPEVFPEEEKPGRAFAIGVYREGGQDAGEASQGYGMANTGDFLTRVTNNAGNNDPAGLVRMLSANRASNFEASHKAPVRVGVTVAWSFLPWLSLTSGLNWTALSSEFEESTASTRAVTRQELGYLGVPLRLEAGWKPWKGLRLYAGAGAMAETCLLAKSVTDSYLMGYREGTVDSKPDTGGLLWSVGALAGAEYRFSPHVGVYLAPGLEYHFDNGSTVRSAYTERPLHYNVSLGLRFDFGQ